MLNLVVRRETARLLKVNYSKQRMERGKAQDMKRRGKGYGVKKRSAGDKSK
jgi:hypothetical protein